MMYARTAIYGQPKSATPSVVSVVSVDSPSVETSSSSSSSSSSSAALQITLDDATGPIIVQGKYLAYAKGEVTVVEHDSLPGMYTCTAKAGADRRPMLFIKLPAPLHLPQQQQSFVRLETPVGGAECTVLVEAIVACPASMTILQAAPGDSYLHLETDRASQELWVVARGGGQPDRIDVQDDETVVPVNSEFLVTFRCANLKTVFLQPKVASMTPVDSLAPLASTPVALNASIASIASIASNASTNAEASVEEADLDRVLEAGAVPSSAMPSAMPSETQSRRNKRNRHKAGTGKGTDTGKGKGGVVTASSS